MPPTFVRRFPPRALGCLQLANPPAVVLVFIVVPVAAVVLVFIVVPVAAVVLVFIVVPVVLVSTVIPAKAGIPRPASDDVFMGIPARARSLVAFAGWFVEGASSFPPSREWRGCVAGMTWVCCGNGVGVLREWRGYVREWRGCVVGWGHGPRPRPHASRFPPSRE